MEFDKDHVWVAGLHYVPVGTKGYCANTVTQLESRVATEYESDVCTICGTQDGYYCVRGKEYNFDGTMFYPIQEKTYRPFETIEEALTLKGKWIKHKHWDCFIEVTNIAMLNGCALINNIDPSFIYELYTMEDGTPIGVEV